MRVTLYAYGACELVLVVLMTMFMRMAVSCSVVVAVLVAEEPGLRPDPPGVDGCASAAAGNECPKRKGPLVVCKKDRHQFHTS